MERSLFDLCGSVVNNAESVGKFQPRPGSPRGQPAWGGSVALGNPGKDISFTAGATLKELWRLLTAKSRNPVRVAKDDYMIRDPRVVAALQPWADISQRFQRTLSKRIRRMFTLNRVTFAQLIATVALAISFSVTAAQQKPVQPDDPDVIRVDTNLVNTLFTAVDKDRHFLTSLKAEDVRIFENNVAQAISLFERETNRPLTLAIMIDTSESQRGVLADEKNAARTFVESVIRSNPGNPANGASGDRAAIISFTGEPKLEQSLTGDHGQLKQGIEKVRIELSPENIRRMEAGEDPLPKEVDPSGYTGIWDAMWMAVDDILSKGPANTRRAIVLLSDGDDTSSTIKRQDVIDLAVKSDVVIYSIGIRDRNFPEGKLDSGALKKVSDRTGGRAFFPQNSAEITAAFAQIDQELRSQYLIAYSPTNPNRDGAYRQIRIDIVNPELRKNRVQLLYRSGYYARNAAK